MVARFLLVCWVFFGAGFAPCARCGKPTTRQCQQCHYWLCVGCLCLNSHDSSEKSGPGRGPGPGPGRGPSPSPGPNPSPGPSTNADHTILRSWTSPDLSLLGHPPQSYPCDCPLDFPHLHIGHDYIGCPFIWLEHNRLILPPTYIPTSLRRPYYQVAISLARVALLTGSHASQPSPAHSSAGNVYRLALDMSNKVAAAVQDPAGHAGNRWNNSVTTAYTNLVDRFLLHVPAGPGPVEDRLLRGLRQRRQEHRRVIACTILSLNRLPHTVPDEFVQHILPFVIASTNPAAYQGAVKLFEKNLPPHHGKTNPAGALNEIGGKYGATPL